MASVSLDTVLLALASNLGATVALEVSALTESTPVVGEVRRYANGRRRSVTRSGRDTSIGLTFDAVSQRAMLATLRGWCGQTVLLRDPFGRKVYGVFYDVPLTERIPVDMPEATLTLQQVTVTEAV